MSDDYDRYTLGACDRGLPLQPWGGCSGDCHRPTPEQEDAYAAHLPVPGVPDAAVREAVRRAEARDAIIARARERRIAAAAARRADREGVVG